MSGKRLATAAAFCVLAIPGALAQKAAPADTGLAAASAPPAARSAQWPVVLHVKSDPKSATSRAWSQQDIELAQARCAVLLKGLDVVAVPEAPIREGAECGTPAPMRLVSLGKSPQVALSPPPVVTCDMIAALHRWLQHNVQPLARKHLGEPVVRIQTMSSYSCRNAYGRARSRLSEHGRANALDIGSFVTARDQAAMVVADWGPTAREIAAQAAAAKAQAEKAQTRALAAEPAEQGTTVPAHRPAAVDAAEGIALRPGTMFSIPGVTVLIPPQGGSGTEMGFTQPSRLGGPKATSKRHLVHPDAKMDFLRAAHRSACKLFSTVLGPEADTTHHNHFHVDLAERVRNTKICE